ncbi:hypothetical protein [Dyadobacter psychrophilus]|uniref:Lipoprotein n=1 Tax=Dyadobacter psychrophilus TaxID=651661 RepID=A0A1T5H786_9BACT|nr:hypothetical protein [Dyadobacter psychrophilus]SKC16563.1 hypothetical protein SAMN05660293_04999 [Dyadobacter psychrophilus]
MKKLLLKGSIAAMLFCFFACSTPPDKLGNLDLVKWRGDRGGCNDVRAGLEKDFRSIEKQLKGKFADDIGDLLGRPDIHQLGERNQKYYVYFLSKGEQCSDIKSKSNAPKVILKFNAVGLLSEITYQSRPL